MAVDQRLLHRVQRTVALLQVLDREQGLAVERRQELDAGIDGAQRQAAHDAAGGGREARDLADHDRAGTAVTLVATFLGAVARGVLAQPVEHAARRVRIRHLDDLTTVKKANGTGRLHGAMSEGWSADRLGLPFTHN